MTLRLMVLVLALMAVSPAPGGAGEVKPVAIYRQLLAASDGGQRFLYDDNHTGRIVWNQQYFLESLVNMYKATGQTHYLDLFVQQADHVLARRDDRAERKDYSGRSRPGWLSGAYYTLGIPVIILDEQAKPSLRVQAIRRGGNNHTTVEIQRRGDRFDLIVKNDFRREEAGECL